MEHALRLKVIAVLYTGIKFAPIAIHRISHSDSSGSRSYGCSFSLAMDHFPNLSDDLLLAFKNAQHLII